MTKPDQPLQSLHDIRTQDVWKGRVNTRLAIIVSSVIVVVVMIVLIVLEPIMTAPGPVAPSLIQTGAQAAFDVVPAAPQSTLPAQTTVPPLPSPSATPAPVTPPADIPVAPIAPPSGATGTAPPPIAPYTGG